MGRLGSAKICARWIGYWASVVLISVPALAQDQFYITVNPIQVCPAGGACPPISEPGSSQIGFVDPATQTDITRAIISQAGIDIHWGAVQTITGPPVITQAPNSLQIFP